ncbi:ATP-binding protein [Streptomyces sp. NPDC004684]
MRAPENRLLRPVRNFSLQVSSTPRGARPARLLTVEQLRTWGLPTHPAEHIVAELAANAATHGRDIRLLVYVVGDTLRIEVTNTRGDRLPRRAADAGDGAESESGRGLLLVDSLADRWGVVPGPPPRKTVWAEVRTGLVPS